MLLWRIKRVPGRVYVQVPRFEHVYYCPKCDRTIPKDRVDKADRELKSRFGVSKLSELRCPVCDCEYIDLDKVRKGGEAHIGGNRKEASSP